MATYRKTQPLQIEGIRETIAVLRGATDTVERKVLIFAVRRAALRVRRSLRAAAPVGATQVLKRSIRLRRVRTRERRGRVRFYIGTSGRGFYGRFLESGWNNPLTGRRSEPAHTIKWMAKAFQQVDAEALRIITEEVQRRLPIEIERDAQRRGALRHRRR